jgi:hypothetical protein
MIQEYLKATHILIQDFRVFEDEVYRKGTPVFMNPIHRKHAGFCCNVVMLDRRGRVRVNKDQALAMFDKSFFKPLKDWFKPI